MSKGSEEEVGRGQKVKERSKPELGIEARETTDLDWRELQGGCRALRVRPESMAPRRANRNVLGVYREQIDAGQGESAWVLCLSYFQINQF